jgi:hypothetical protein
LALTEDGDRMCIVDRDRHAGLDAAGEYGDPRFPRLGQCLGVVLLPTPPGIPLPIAL